MPRHYLIGMVAGWAVWLILMAGAYGVDASERFAPMWVREADIPDTVATALIVAALPVKFGGWLFIWGDGPQPPEWVSGLPLNTLVGLVLYGSLGVAAAAIYGRGKRRSKSFNES